MARKFKRTIQAAALSAALGFAAAQPAAAVELLINGDFETGAFPAWTVDNRAGSSGTWFIDTPGSTTPTSGHTTSAAGGGPHGSFYAVTDQGGPGTHVLRQSFTVAPGSTSVKLSFDMFVNDYDAGPIIGAQGLDHNGAANQHARVDILSAGATAFDTGAGVLGNFYQGVDAGTDPHAFTHYVFDITALVGGGGTFQVRFGEVDNQLFLNQGVDNVSIDATVPEPASLALLGFGLIALGWNRRRKA